MQTLHAWFQPLPKMHSTTPVLSLDLILGYNQVLRQGYRLHRCAVCLHQPRHSNALSLAPQFMGNIQSWSHENKYSQWMRGRKKREKDGRAKAKAWLTANGRRSEPALSCQTLDFSINLVVAFPFLNAPALWRSMFIYYYYLNNFWIFSNNILMENRCWFNF